MPQNTPRLAIPKPLGNETNTRNAFNAILDQIDAAAAKKADLDTHVGSGGSAHAAATEQVAGFMSAADKLKLDGLSNYVLPVATNGVLGGVKQGTGITIAADGTLNVTPYTPPATMAKTDVAQTWTAAQTFTADITVKKGVGALWFDASRTNKSYVRWNANTSSDYGMEFNVDGNIAMTLFSSGGMKLVGAVQQVKGVSTQGTYGISTVVRSVSDVALTTNTATQVLVLSSPLAANYVLKGYLRAVAACTVTIAVSFTDVGGAVTQPIYSNQQLNAGDRFSILPYFFNATASGAITVTVTASVANALYVSASLVGE